MASLRVSDRWLAVGLVAFIYIGGRIISWQIEESDRLQARIKARDKEEKAPAPLTPPKEKTEDDISNNDLSILTQFPDWNTRQAAIEIVLLRFAASKECREDLHRKLNDPGIDPDERETAQHLAQWAARSYNIDLSVRRRFDFRDNATTEASEHEAAGGEGEEGWEPSSPLFEPGFSLGGHVFDGGADDEEESEEEEESVDDSGRAEENRDNFHALPMNPDDMSDAEDVEAERRTRRRNAMVLGTDGDGLEIFEGGELRQSIEGLSPRTTDVERTAEGLLQQVRGLDNRVQGLLDTLRRMSSPDG